MDKPTLIYKVLSGRANEAEKAELNAWIVSDPSHAEEFDDIKLLHDGTLEIEQRMIERDDQFYDGLRRIQDRIKALKKGRKRAKLYKTAVAVIIISAVTIGVLVYSFMDNRARPLQEPSNRQDNTIVSGALLHENLTFQDATLARIFDVLEDKYDVIFQVGSQEILSCRFTGTFSGGITIGEMIRALAQSESFNYTVVNSKTYALHGKGCP